MGNIEENPNGVKYDTKLAPTLVYYNTRSYNSINSISISNILKPLAIVFSVLYLYLVYTITL